LKAEFIAHDVQEFQEYLKRPIAGKDTFAQSNPKNKIVLGAPGTGKTTLMLNIFKEKGNAHWEYILCADLKTSRRVFSKLHSSDLRAVIKKFKESPKIIIFDEINKITNLEEFFNDLNAFFRATNCPIILITNRQDLKRRMPADAEGTFHFTFLKFVPYNAIQIKEILLSRIAEARENGKDISSEKVEVPVAYISALIARDGNTRRAFELLNNVISEGKYTNADIDKYLDDMDRQSTLEWIEVLGDTEKIFLKCLLDLVFEKNENRVSYSEIVDYFHKNSHIRTSARVTQILDKIQDERIIEIKIYYPGGKGTRNYGRKDSIIRFIDEKNIPELGKYFYPNRDYLWEKWEEPIQEEIKVEQKTL